MIIINDAMCDASTSVSVDKPYSEAAIIIYCGYVGEPGVRVCEEVTDRTSISGGDGIAYEAANGSSVEGV